MSILAYIGPHGCDVFDQNENVQKVPKHDFWTDWSVLGAFVAKTHFRDSLGELLSINANVGPHGCDVFDRNENVQKAPKHYFWTYWSVLGAFMAKTHFVIRAANFCQLMPILAHDGAIFLSGTKKFKKNERSFLDILDSIGCVRGKNSLRDSRGELLSIDANIGTRGCDVFLRNQKVQKKRNMIFGYIGLYCVHLWQKLTS